MRDEAVLASTIVPMRGGDVVVLAILGGMFTAYFISVYRKFQWRTIELLAMIIMGGILPAATSSSIKEMGPESFVILGMVAIFGQGLSLMGTLIGMRWILRWQMNCTWRRLGTIIYGCLCVPMLFVTIPVAIYVLAADDRNTMEFSKRLLQILAFGAAVAFWIPALILQFRRVD
jgi:hypothetical protein